MGALVFDVGVKWVLRCVVKWLFDVVLVFGWEVVLLGRTVDKWLETFAVEEIVFELDATVRRDEDVALLIGFEWEESLCESFIIEEREEGVIECLLFSEDWKDDLSFWELLLEEITFELEIEEGSLEEAETRVLDMVVDFDDEIREEEALLLILKLTDDNKGFDDEDLLVTENLILK